MLVCRVGWSAGEEDPWKQASQCLYSSLCGCDWGVMQLLAGKKIGHEGVGGRKAGLAENPGL